MFGVVCTNPVTGCVEPWTIAGPTDGSTNIVHHDENRDYQLATANDCQYGASYLGITECCKPLYNPSTGNLTVDCATTTATGVDVNADDTVDVAHPIIAQNYDCDDAEFKNKLIKTSCFSYNPQCYVCNDPATGNPVRKPVVHIGTLCADEYLGFNEGLPRRTDVCEDCWRQIPFIGEDNGGETLDTSSDCDAFSHNSCTCTTRMEHLELADICKPGDIYVGNTVFNPNAFDYSTKDPTNTFNTKYVGFRANMSGGGFHVCEVNPSTCCAKYRLSLSDDCSSIETNSLTIKPTGNASLCLNLNYIPLTSNTESSNYELVGLNVSNNQLKKLDGFSYDPTTCYLCGNFCGNINAFPIQCYYHLNDCYYCNTGNVDNQFGWELTACRCDITNPGWKDSRLTLTYASATLRNVCNYVRVCENLICLCSTDNIAITSDNDLALESTCASMYGSTCARLTSQSLTIIHAGCPGKRGVIDIKSDSYVANCAPAITFINNCSGRYIERHTIVGNGRLTKVCYSDGCEYPYALMCDISAVSPIKKISCAIANPGDYTIACFISDVCEAGIYSIDLYNNNLCWTITDQIGCSRTLKGLTGILTMPENGGFGHFSGSACGDFMIDMNVSAGRGALENIVIAPIPGTMYGTASVNGINVEGTV